MWSASFSLCCSVLQCVAVCCSVLQCVAVCDIYLQGYLEGVIVVESLIQLILQSSSLVFICYLRFCVMRHTSNHTHIRVFNTCVNLALPELILNCWSLAERWGAGVETQKNVRGEIRRWGRVPFNKHYAPSLSTIYDGA